MLITATGIERRRVNGRRSHNSGLAAEDAVAAYYRRAGGTVVERRHKTPYGELDLIVEDGPILVFVEVKRCKHGLGCDSPVSHRQWQRLESAAIHYMLDRQNMTGVHPICRFDVAVVDGMGQVQIIENARSFDAH